jgi:hypothetical protein
MRRWTTFSLVAILPLFMGCADPHSGINEGKRGRDAAKKADEMIGIVRFVLVAGGTAREKKVRIDWHGRRPNQEFTVGKNWQNDYRVRKPVKVSLVVQRTVSGGDVRCVIRNPITKENLSSQEDSFWAKCGFWFT